jgi:hypothetical protein
MGFQQYPPPFSATVGTINSSTTITGNPPNLDTAGELALAIQTIQTRFIDLDQDNDGRIDIDKQQDALYLFPVPLLQWVQPHTIGRVPDVTILDTFGNTINADVRPSATTVIVDFGAPQAGQLILR